jgi:hypothetical protein
MFLGNGRRALRFPEQFQSLRHFGRRVQIILEQELDGAFPRLASLAHECSMAQKAELAKEILARW